MILALCTSGSGGILSLMARRPHSQFLDREVMMLFSQQDYYIRGKVTDIVREAGAWFYEITFPDGTKTLESCECLLSVVLLDEATPDKPIVNKNNVVNFKDFKKRQGSK